ncbi:unnamed protein product [Discula destructiva]
MGTTKTSTPGIGDGVAAFFARCGFPADAQEQCRSLAQDLFPGAGLKDARPQGYCSYTLYVGADRIVQFRPPAHKLRMCVADAACEVYGNLAPRTEHLTVMRPAHCLSSKGRSDRQLACPQTVDEGVVMDDGQDYLEVISMKRIYGISLLEARRLSAGSLAPPRQLEEQHRSVICQFAGAIASGMRKPRQEADVEVSDLRGRVGGSLMWRLVQMHAHLPERFRPVTGRTLELFDAIISLPWVLTHGDLVPANIMVERSRECSGRLALTGLLDWAEAEYLPFGVGLYGLEEVLGDTDASGSFSYYSDEDELRSLFWAQLEVEVSAFGFVLDEHTRRVVDAAHVLGILLWHGIAFDDGKLDRVVQEAVDDKEMQRLDLFFAGPRPVDGDGRNAGPLV